MIDARTALLARVKAELRITVTADDTRIDNLITEAEYHLDKFKNTAVTDATLSPLDFRAIVLYIALQFDGPDEQLERALAGVYELVRDS